MAKYKVLETSFIGNRLVQPDEVVDYDGEAGPNLELVEAGDDDKPEAERKAGPRRTKPAET